MKALVVGAGPVGRFIYELLTANHQSATLLSRGDSLREIESNSSIWICVKSYDLESILSALEGKLDSSHASFLLSNGIGVYDQALAVISEANIYRLLLNFGIGLDANGAPIRHGEPQTFLSCADAYSSNLAIWATRLRDWGLIVEVDRSVASSEWRKLMVNLVVNSLATLANAKNKIIIEDKNTHARAEKLLSEIRAVAHQNGVDLSGWSDVSIFASIESHGENLNSTLLDIRKGKQTELLQMLDGFISRARVVNVKTPIAIELKQELEAFARKFQQGE